MLDKRALFRMAGRKHRHLSFSFRVSSAVGLIGVLHQVTETPAISGTERFCLNRDWVLAFVKHFLHIC